MIKKGQKSFQSTVKECPRKYLLFTYLFYIFLPQDLCGHLDELIYYILIYAWIQLAIIVTNPYEGDDYSDIDIDVIESIKGELYAASAALHF